MQVLVFEVCKEVDDLCFHLEVLDRKGTQILQMLSALHRSCHPSKATQNALGEKQTILVLAPERSSVEDAAPDSAPTLKATSLDAVPRYKPTTGSAQVSICMACWLFCLHFSTCHF
jgi:hypothetical protein